MNSIYLFDHFGQKYAYMFNIGKRDVSKNLGCHWIFNKTDLKPMFLLCIKIRTFFQIHYVCSNQHNKLLIIFNDSLEI